MGSLGEAPKGGLKRTYTSLNEAKTIGLANCKTKQDVLKKALGLLRPVQCTVLFIIF